MESADRSALHAGFHFLSLFHFGMSSFLHCHHLPCYASRSVSDVYDVLHGICCEHISPCDLLLGLMIVGAFWP